MAPEWAARDQVPDEIVPAGASSAGAESPVAVTSNAANTPIDPALLEIEAALAGEGDVTAFSTHLTIQRRRMWNTDGRSRRVLPLLCDGRFPELKSRRKKKKEDKEKGKKEMSGLVEISRAGRTARVWKALWNTTQIQYLVWSVVGIPHQRTIHPTSHKIQQFHQSVFTGKQANLQGVADLTLATAQQRTSR